MGREFVGSWRERSEDAKGTGSSSGGGGGADNSGGGAADGVDDEGIGGAVTLTMAPDGLSFEGEASYNDERWRWEGERIPQGPSAEMGARERWHARVLVERSRARLRLGRKEDALRDAGAPSESFRVLPSPSESF